MQCPGKLTNETLENGPTPKFFSWILPLLVVRNCSEQSSYAIFWKTNKRNFRKWKKTNFGPNLDSFGPNLSLPVFLWILPLLVARNCCKLSSKAIEKKTDEQNLRKWKKKLIQSPILDELWASKFFSWVWPLPDVRNCCKL